MKISKIALRGFRPTDRGIKQVLGKLEAEVMQILWQRSEQTVSEVEDRLRRKRGIAHTTVLGKAFVYAPRYTREEFERGLAQEVLGALLGGLGEPVLSTFVELVGEDEARLERLEELIRRKREEKK